MTFLSFAALAILGGRGDDPAGIRAHAALAVSTGSAIVDTERCGGQQYNAVAAHDGVGAVVL